VAGSEPDDAQLLRDILAGDRRAISRAITLLESTRAGHRRRSDLLLQGLMPHTGKCLRLGVSGAPGAGKSTFIEAFGLLLVEAGRKVAVLSIDPSSSLTGGSILADKTRMQRLAGSAQAYIRPSPSSGALGGVAACTREAMLVCEAAGHDVVIVETVGVGQSETAVAGMTDLLLLLQLPNAGDDLQAIKKGIVELADLVAVNKADLDAAGARRAAAWLASARRDAVPCVSALDGSGLPELWSRIESAHAERMASGSLQQRRQQQALTWMWELVHAGMERALREHPAVAAMLESLVGAVRESRMPPRAAARELLARFAGAEQSVGEQS
jgi:LAO/AO transport system kinase